MGRMWGILGGYWCYWDGSGSTGVELGGSERREMEWEERRASLGAIGGYGRVLGGCGRVLGVTGVTGS